MGLLIIEQEGLHDEVLVRRDQIYSCSPNSKRKTVLYSASGHGVELPAMTTEEIQSFKNWLSGGGGSVHKIRYKHPSS